LKNETQQGFLSMIISSVVEVIKGVLLGIDLELVEILTMI